MTTQSDTAAPSASSPPDPFAEAPVIATAATLRGRPLGEILQAIAGVPAERVAEALTAQQSDPTGPRFGDILVKAKLATEEQVLRAIAIQLDLPFVSSIDAA